MLRIRRNVQPQRVVLLLHGHIVAEWADLLERECLEWIRLGLRVVLDLGEVTYIGPSGLQALGRLSIVGVGITGCSPLMAEMLEQEGIGVDGTIRIIADGMTHGDHELN